MGHKTVRDVADLESTLVEHAGASFCLRCLYALLAEKLCLCVFDGPVVRECRCKACGRRGHQYFSSTIESAFAPPHA